MPFEQPNEAGSSNRLPTSGECNTLIHVVDTDSKTCEALTVLLRLEGYATDFSTSSVRFFERLKTHIPASLIVNIDLGNEDGVDLVRQTLDIHPGIAVIVLCARGAISRDPQRTERLLSMFGHGVYCISALPVSAPNFVNSLSNALKQAAPRSASVDKRARCYPQLTPREQDVLELIVKGQTSKEAAMSLGISPRTVEVYRARIMSKVGAKNTADLVRLAMLH